MDQIQKWLEQYMLRDLVSLIVRYVPWYFQWDVTAVDFWSTYAETTEPLPRYAWTSCIFTVTPRESDHYRDAEPIIHIGLCTKDGTEVCWTCPDKTEAVVTDWGLDLSITPRYDETFTLIVNLTGSKGTVEGWVGTKAHKQLDFSQSISRKQTYTLFYDTTDAQIHFAA